MKRTIVSLVLTSLAGLALACGSSSSGGGSGKAPAPPALGAQMDRMGRPAVQTATNHTFDSNDGTKGMAKDAWNSNSDPTAWVSAYTSEIEKNLAILDSLDGVCGNQLFADKTKTDASRYATFASVLADDRVWVNAAGATCTTYLAVEANATNLLANADCGGRKPSYDAIKVTYSAVAAGALMGVTDGTAAVPAKTSGSTFPYLGAPL
jgi:hypothetical protein